MKKTAFLLVLIALTVTCYSQTDNWYFSFSMAGSQPLGSFSQASLNPVNNTSGFAQKGFSLLLDATYPLNTHWGFKGLVLINTSSLNNNNLDSMLVHRVPVSQLTEIPAKSYYSFTTNSWTTYALLVGPVYTLTLGRAFLDFQLQGGVNVTYLPQQKLQYNNPADQWLYLDKNSNSTAVTLGVLAGTAFRFPVTPRINLKVGLDYFRSGANLQYQQVRIYEPTGVSTPLGSGSNTIPIQMITGTIGLVYYLN